MKMRWRVAADRRTLICSGKERTAQSNEGQSLQPEAYEETARLHISPKPDSILRVFMVYTPLAQPVQVEESELNVFERKGFTAVERGGKEILAE